MTVCLSFNLPCLLLFILHLIGIILFISFRKKFATEKTMNEKDGRNTQRITPCTERNASGRNWELFKNKVSNAPPVEVNIPDNKNVKNKFARKCQRSNKKHTFILNPDTKPQHNKEEKEDISPPVEVNIPDNENVKNKFVRKRQRSNKKHTFILTPDTKPQHNKEKKEGYDSNMNEWIKNIAMDFGIVDISPPVEVSIPGNENVQKKSVPNNRRPDKKHTFILNPDTKPQLRNGKEEDYNDNNKKKLTKHIAMDCEMVGIGDGTESMIARVSIVNSHGYCIYDKYVKPREPVQDYRTKVSGIRPHNLINGEVFQIVQREVAEILKGRILVGHALKHDLDVLYLSHPRKHLRDTSKFKIFRQLSRGNTPSLKKLACELLGREIQTGEHSSIEDAKAAMQLYTLYKNQWERELFSKR